MGKPVRVRAPMPASKRAKQFQPFDALKGLREAIEAREHLTVPRKHLTEDRISEISGILQQLQKGQVVTVVYYGEAEQNYLQITGPVTKADSFLKTLQIGETVIAFPDISEIWE